MLNVSAQRDSDPEANVAVVDVPPSYACLSNYSVRLCILVLCVHICTCTLQHNLIVDQQPIVDQQSSHVCKCTSRFIKKLIDSQGVV